MRASEKLGRPKRFKWLLHTKAKAHPYAEWICEYSTSMRNIIQFERGYIAVARPHRWLNVRMLPSLICTRVPWNLFAILFFSCASTSDYLFIYLVFMSICKENLMAFRRACRILWRWWMKCMECAAQITGEGAEWRRRPAANDCGDNHLGLWVWNVCDIFYLAHPSHKLTLKYAHHQCELGRYLRRIQLDSRLDRLLMHP